MRVSLPVRKSPQPLFSMKKALLFLGVVLLALARQPLAAQTTISVLNGVLYYDGYAATVATPAPPAGVIRHRNDLYARQLTTAELQSIGTQLTMKVTVAAACDNYDRIGNVNLALVPKGATTYNPANVPHLELGRYITPFMDKNKTPSSLTYEYDISNMAALFKETTLAATYDFWVELQLFGVPYAANTQIVGCGGRTDVFYGSLDFITNAAAPAQSGTNVLVPMLFQASLNNYQAAATDTLGKTTRTIKFTVPAALTDAALFLITSNHGANSGGEEYNRRVHYVYVDNDLKLTYTPGRVSCEPFRQYNTQANGIYGPSPRSNAVWQSFSNWCPGDKIDIRRISLGALSAGTHSFRIHVPTAVFVGGQGDIPTSVYLQGKTSGVLSTAGSRGATGAFFLYPNPSAGFVTVANPAGVAVRELVVRNALGQVVHRAAGSAAPQFALALGSLAVGTYVAEIHTAEGVATRTFQVAR